MATNKFWALALALVCVSAWSREAASVSDCQAAAGKPAIADAKAAVERALGDLAAIFKLADAWSDAGCFSDAVQVLQSAQAQVAPAQRPVSKELETRLRVARSLVGEEHYFDNIDRADADAKLKRDTFRCSTLSDLEACGEAVRLKPDDPSLLTAQGDALIHAKRPADALVHYRRAAALSPNPDLIAKLTAAEAQAPGSHPSVAASAATAPSPAGEAQKPIRVASAQPMPSPAPATASSAPGRRYSNAPKDERSH